MEKGREIGEIKMRHIWEIAESIISFLFSKILHIELTDEKAAGILQFLKFGIVGLSNTIISYVIYIIALFVFHAMNILGNTDYLVAQVIAFILSVLWSFYWNNRYVFDNKNGRNIFKALLKTYASYAFTGLFLSSMLSIMWVEVLGVNKLIAPVINLLVSVPVNFIMNKYWAFKG